MAARRSSPTLAQPVAEPLAAFSPAVRDWFQASFAQPTAAQVGGWAAIAAGGHTLIHAPTGSGKTLAAFLWCLDRLTRAPSPTPTRQRPGAVRILYISPLKALSYDVERNLRAPLAGIALAAGRRGEPVPVISVGPSNRRLLGRGAPERRPASAGHPHHHPGVALPAPDQRCPGDAGWSRARDRGRGPCDRRLEAGRPSRAQPGAARAADRSSAAADRPVGDATAARHDRPFPGRRGAGPRGERRRCRLAQAARAVGGRPGRGHEPARRVGAARGASRRAGGGLRSAVQHLAVDPSPDPRADPGPSQHDRLLQQPAAGRTAGPAPQRTGRRRTRPGPPWFDRV